MAFNCRNSAAEQILPLILNLGFLFEGKIVLLDHNETLELTEIKENF